MSIKVEDIVPFGSGTSHLGVDEGTAAGSFNAASLTPFGHIVQLSGVFVDPVQGQSGILRFNLEQSAFETSVDGGITFTAIGSDVTLSGVRGVNGINVQQVGGDFVVDGASISGLATAVDLQQAYDNGDQITLYVAPNDDYNGVVLRETNPGTRNIEAGNFGFGIMVSGHSATPTDLSSAYNTRIGSNAIVVQESGRFNVNPNALTLGFVDSQLTASAQDAQVEARGDLDVTAGSGMAISANGTMTITTVGAASDLNFTVGDDELHSVAGNITFLPLGDISLFPGDDLIGVVTNNVSISAGIGVDEPGQIALSSWGGSGKLDYRFGPFEAWHVSPSHTADFFPVAHSGQVVQMIEEIAPTVVSLQDAYEVNPDIALNDGDMRVIASDDKLVLGTFGDKAPVNVSGIVSAPPDTDLELGDMFMMAHGQPDRDPGTTSLAEIAAESLGLPSIGLVTNGSGIAPIVPASGIARYKNSALQSFTATTATNIIFDAEYFDHDQFYEYDSSVTGIRVFVPGLYKVTSNVLLFSNQTSSVISNLTRNGTVLNGYASAQLVLQNTFTSSHNYGLINLNAGDYISIIGVGTGAGSLTVFNAGDAAIDIEYKGPPKGQLGG